MNSKRSLVAATSTLALCAGLVACASSPPTMQLVDARRTYQQARNARGAELVPARVLEARQALNRAELAHKDDPGSETERHYGYLADRQARLSITYGNIAYARQLSDRAEREHASLQERLKVQAQRDLDKTRNELKATRSALTEVERQFGAQGADMQGLAERQRELENRKATLEAQQIDLERQLVAGREELEQERNARLQAEESSRAALESLREIANVKAEAEQVVISLTGSVLFRTNESHLLPTASRALEQVADALKQQGEDKMIIVEGHTDSRGTDANNEQLSQDRAQAVRDFLVEHGVKASQIRAVGRGESEPIANNDTAEGRANNPRVDIIIRNSEISGVRGPETTE